MGDGDLPNEKKMTSVGKAIRKAAEPFKSFPEAIAHLVRAAFSRQATEVTIRYCFMAQDRVGIWVEDNGRELSESEQINLVLITIAAVSKQFPENLALTCVHHADMFAVRVRNNSMIMECPNSEWGKISQDDASKDGHTKEVGVGLLDLGGGTGVNKRQDRSAARLLKRLPALLSPREASMVTVVNEKGVSHWLVYAYASVWHKGYVFWIPPEMACYATLDKLDTGLSIKYGMATVSVRELMKSLPPHIAAHPLKPFASPWLGGVIDVQEPRSSTPDLGEVLVALAGSWVVDIANNQLLLLARQLLDDVMGRRKRPIQFGGGSYHIRADLGHILEKRRPVRVDHDLSTGGFTAICIDALDPVFQVDNRSDAICERMLWQVAIFLHEHQGRKGSLNDSYLELRQAIESARA